MRLSVASLRRMIKGNLHVEFVRQDLTSYSGLELLRRYLRRVDLASRLRAACAATGGDYGGGHLALLVLALFYVGARRLEPLSRSKTRFGIELTDSALSQELSR
jgi:MYXO-CTERM domain-containing protein